MEQQKRKNEPSRHRPLVKHICPICEAEFYGTGNSVYCTEKCKNKRIYEYQKANPPSPASVARKREYMRKYILRRYREDPAFRRKMIDSSRRYQQRRRKEAKEGVGCSQ